MLRSGCKSASKPFVERSRLNLVDTNRLFFYVFVKWRESNVSDTIVIFPRCSLELAYQKRLNSLDTHGS